MVVELKARFDEEANINWAEMLESIGAQVVYGVVGLKTHAKMLLMTRREGKQMRRYGHLSTGNYNPRTARLYTDISHLTADPLLTADMEAVFVHLASQSKLPKLNRMWLAPFDLHSNIRAQIAALAAAAARGAADAHRREDECADRRGAGPRRWCRAGRKGVKIDLIMRGACTLPAQAPGLTDNVRVRSVIGRFLEHSRVFYFRQWRGRVALPLERRLDEPQHDAAHRARLARDRPGAAPAPHRRVPGRLPARRRAMPGTWVAMASTPASTTTPTRARPVRSRADRGARRAGRP